MTGTLSLYKVQEGRLKPVLRAEARSHLESLVWIDLLNPSLEEEKFVEHLLSVEIPTREEMHEIELSSRLYQQAGTLYTTMTIVVKSDTDEPQIHAISFILHNNTLITLRYCEPQPFHTYVAHPEWMNIDCRDGISIFIGLLEAIIDRMADVLEKVGHTLDDTTRGIFRPQVAPEKGGKKPDFTQMLKHVGINGDLISKTRESFVSISRLVSFIASTPQFSKHAEAMQHIDILFKDISALSDHASFLSNKVNFLLDAILGMINIEQNGIIKIFSVASVVFLPPTLVASIYGMNFQIMPELNWDYGYPIALLLMVLSAYLPYKYFRHKGWL